MRFILLAALVCGCGAISPLVEDAGGRGGEVSSSTGGTGGRGGDPARGGANGTGGGQGGTGGTAVTYPPCGKIAALDNTASGTPHCLWDCEGESDAGLLAGEVDAGAGQLCLLSTSEAAKFTNAPGPIYCWQMARGNEQPPAACY